MESEMPEQLAVATPNLSKDQVPLDVDPRSALDGRDPSDDSDSFDYGYDSEVEEQEADCVYEDTDVGYSGTKPLIVNNRPDILPPKRNLFLRTPQLNRVEPGPKKVLFNDKDLEYIGYGSNLASKPELASPSTTPNIFKRTLKSKLEKKPSSTKLPMCIVCDQRPCYNDGQKSFPTCGYTCAAIQNSNNKDHLIDGQLKMCEVCNLRPRCRRRGKIYPTCGLSCAAKRHPPGTAMCDFCKQRPRSVVNGKVYPHCGLTCRDKAKNATKE
ncbi:hypothetical protein B0H34DRAFT_149888 [Crassisporium funariophilum]|nr:hypothetical protein B0H34DRAFT_149888 [Crassisporium funariophilum]